MLEQLQAEEEENARDVLAVYAVRSDPGKMRSELNKRSRRTAPAVRTPAMPDHEICYGSSEIRRDPEGSGLYQIRVANHPQENYQPVLTKVSRSGIVAPESKTTETTDK